MHDKIDEHLYKNHRMPREVSAIRFNKLCELNYKANPIKSMTCGQFITACQQLLITIKNGYGGCPPTADLIRKRGSYLPEKVVRHAIKFEKESLTFRMLMNAMEYTDVQKFATIVIKEVRESNEIACE